MLAQLAVRPGDHELRGRAATALDDQGRYDDAVGVLAPLINLTAHDDDAELPCLCKRCFAGAGKTAGAHDMKFIRGFAVVHCLGIVTSIFSSVFVSRGIVNLIYGRKKKLAAVAIGQVWRPDAAAKAA